ncbi:adipolin isoform X1 [Alosa sapidissima]|uniref:adipolin isoform X1 n=1 Tax=Alosa sapidissima TaxID=34773 RepID=UPI001C0A3B8A|nr:adipolin isoform X1 [Alosa sapidissima]
MRWILVLLLVWALGGRSQLCAGGRGKGRRWQKDVQITELLNATLTSTEERKITELHALDPQGSWRDFVNRPDDSLQRRCRNKKKTLPGPPGPPGPRGPPGLPGAAVTQSVLLQEFKQMIREATQRRELAVEGGTSPTPSAGLVALGDTMYLRRIEEAFHCKLKQPIIVEKRGMAEMHNFQIPMAKGGFVRGAGLDLSSGRFTAPLTGIYQLSTNLHISRADQSETLRSRGQLRPQEHVLVHICLESLCNRHISLEMVASLEGKGHFFTVCVHGLLELQVGQYVSVFVVNESASPITVQAGSDFTGLLLGL